MPFMHLRMLRPAVSCINSTSSGHQDTRGKHLGEGLNSCHAHRPWLHCCGLLQVGDGGVDRSIAERLHTASLVLALVDLHTEFLQHGKFSVCLCGPICSTSSITDAPQDDHGTCRATTSAGLMDARSFSSRYPSSSSLDDCPATSPATAFANSPSHQVAPLCSSVHAASSAAAFLNALASAPASHHRNEIKANDVCHSF